jgi:phospho-N-acetylmuramoyl-pentapeptide-transferase
MLYHLLYSLHNIPSLRFLNVVRYVSTRSILAILTALLLGLLLGPWLIRQLHKMQVGESIRTDGPEGHQKKAGTPTMGGTVDPVLRQCRDAVLV